MPSRNQCEELRSTESKRTQDLVAAERTEQLREKAAHEQARREDDEMYARLWYDDMAAKARREEQDTMRQSEANRATLEVLQHQMAALEEAKTQEKALVLEEAQILAERSRLRALEEQAALEEKRRKQQETRAMYDRSLAAKREKQAREMQEQLAFDLRILEQLLEESQNEAMEQQTRKVRRGFVAMIIKL